MLRVSVSGLRGWDFKRYTLSGNLLKVLVKEGALGKRFMQGRSKQKEEPEP